MNKPKKKFRLKRMIGLPWEMMESEAFNKKLTKTEIIVLMRFYQKMTWSEQKLGGQKTKVYNKGGLDFTYTEAESYLGISTSSFDRAIKKLVRLGFIDIEHQGGGLARDYSRYKISDRWMKYGTPQFQEVKKPRVLQAGLDVKARMEAKRKRQRPKLELVKRVKKSCHP